MPNYMDAITVKKNGCCILFVQPIKKLIDISLFDRFNLYTTTTTATTINVHIVILIYNTNIPIPYRPHITRILFVSHK